MGVLQVPSDMVFSAVLRLCSKMERDICGEAKASPTLLSFWMRELIETLPVPDFGEGYNPSKEWDEQDRYTVMWRVLREIQRTNGPEDRTKVLGWICRLEAACQCKKEYLELMRHQLLSETIH